jgi:diguanylate cyclase (GGDEF)-like protein
VALRNVTPAVAIEQEPEQGSGRPTPEALVESYRRLAEVFHLVLSEQSLDTLLDLVADTLGDLVPYDDLHVYEADVTRRELVPVLVRSEWKDAIMGTSPAFGQGITGWAVANRQPVLANEAHLDPRVAFVPGTPLEPEALISIPLIARGALKGALNIYRLGETAFEEYEFELAKWFGDAAALALDNAQVRARLEHQAQTDSLTGLYNHRYFHERLRAELNRASRTRDSIAVLMLDIDDFKRVNDIRGHGVGDEVLIALGEAISSLVRSSDIVCRLGGDEFAVIMPSCGQSDAVGLARRLSERLAARPIDRAGEVTVSVGISCGPDQATNPRELVACADTAMMTAKARGKNQIVLFDEETSECPGSYENGRDAGSIAHLKMLQSVAGRLNRLSSTSEIAEAIVSELRTLIDYHSCRVYIVEADEVMPVAVRGELEASDPEGSTLRVKVGVGVTGSVAATGRSMLVPNALECEEAIQIPGTEAVDESAIVVPLRYGANVNGVLFLSKLGIDQFDESDLRLLEVVAGYAAVAFENARLYESLRQEAENAKAWLEFADAISGAESFQAVADITTSTVARLLERDQCSLWLQDGYTGDFRCVASFGYLDNPKTAAIAGARILGSASVGITGRRRPFLRTAEETRKNFVDGDDLDLDPCTIAIAPLDPGYGVVGWLSVRSPDELHFTEERVRLLEGLAYRASMALQRALLYRDQKENAQVASALLEFAQALVEVEDLAEIEQRIAERTARVLNLPESTLWLQDLETGEVRAEAVWGLDGEERARAFATRYTAQTAERFVDAPTPFLLFPEDYRDLPDFHDRGEKSWWFAVAPFRFDGGRMGFLIAGGPPEDPGFNELALKMLAGLADQAKLAIAGAR